MEPETGNHKSIRIPPQNLFHHGVYEFGRHGLKIGGTVMDRGSILRGHVSDEGENPHSRFRKVADILRIHIPVPVHQTGHGNSIHMNHGNSAVPPDCRFQFCHRCLILFLIFHIHKTFFNRSGGRPIRKSDEMHTGFFPVFLYPL